jgi:hypothetical protein
MLYEALIRLLANIKFIWLARTPNQMSTTPNYLYHIDLNYHLTINQSPELPSLRGTGLPSLRGILLPNEMRNLSSE